MALRNDRSIEAPHGLVPVPTRRVPDSGALPYQPAWLQAADQHTLPINPRRLRATLHYCCHPWYRVPKALLLLAGRGARGCRHECSYTIAGGLRVIDKMYAFGAALHHEQGVALALGSSHQYRAKERHINARRARGILIAAALGALAILGLWLGLCHPYAGGLTGVGLVSVLDAIGRQGRAPKQKPVKKPQPLQPGMPSAVLWGQVSGFLTEYKVDHAIQVYDVRIDPWREVYHVDVHTTIELDVKFLRALEKWVRAPDASIRVTTSHLNAADKTMTIPYGDRLANIAELPWIPAGRLSAWQPLPLGESSNPDTPYELILAGQHATIVGSPGAGKTTVHTNNSIDRLSACRDAVQWGATLDKPENFKAWGSVLSLTAYTVADIDDMLDRALAELSRRSDVLDELTQRARQIGDPSIRRKEWSPDLGPALFIWLDEFAQMAQWNGTRVDENGNKPNLLIKVERLLRVGRAHAISVGMCMQASGTQDSGSTVVSKMATLKIVGPCDESDTVSIFGKDKRDQGYAPHLFKPAKLGGSHHDAGKAYIDGAGFGPDPVRGGAPFDVLARSMRREKEWEQLGNRPLLPIEATVRPMAYIDAQTLPPALSLIDAALRHYNARALSTKMILKYAQTNHELAPDNKPWTETNLSTELRKEIPGNDKGQLLRTWDDRCAVLCAEEKQKRVKCYRRVDVDQALRAVEEA